MHKRSWKSYVGWAGTVLVVASGTLTPVMVRSFGAHRATTPELLVDYTILACSIGLAWVLAPMGPSRRSENTQVFIWLLGAAALAVVILVTHDSVPEAVVLYFAVPILRMTHPSRSPGPSTRGQWALRALLVCGSVLATAIAFKLESW